MADHPFHLWEFISPLVFTLPFSNWFYIVKPRDSPGSQLPSSFMTTPRRKQVEKAECTKIIDALNT